MKYLLPFIAYFLTIHLALSQTAITGNVLDSETKEPLPYTNIAVSGQPKGTVSNIEGRFMLNMDGINPSDSIVFSHIGYKTVKVKAADLHSKTTVMMMAVSFNLKEIQVSSKPLTAKDIVKLVEKNYEKNYPSISHKQRIFLHRYEKTPFPEKNKITLKESNFVGMDKETFDQLFSMMPKEFIEYQDALVDLYQYDDEKKLMPIEGISLEEGSQKEVFKEIENKLSGFFEDIQKTRKEEGVYYKVRTGIIGFKLDNDKNDHAHVGDSIYNAYKEDPTSYPVSTKMIKNVMLKFIKDYSHVESENWEFINKSGKYKYTMDDITIFDDDLVYKISFTPKSGGLFEGTMYVSTSSYAVLQLDFAFAKGKQSEKIQLMGFGHAMNFKKGKVIFEKGEKGYFIKYIYAEQHESASIERKFSVMKKQKRFLIDKELNEIKMKAELYFDTQSHWEILVLDRTPIDKKQFEKIEQPMLMKFRKEYSYSSDMWKMGTGIAPSSELSKYKRK